MAMPAEFSVYQNEADFRDRFLVPLLHRLGFSVVVNYHGTREFGRDLIFAEIDRFGHVVYFALQAKFVPSIGQGDAHDLVRDAVESFSHDFLHPQKQTTERVCRFYVANGGSIATNARDNFFQILQKPYAANSVLLDGQSLLTLHRIIGFRGSAREVFAGLLLEQACNRRHPMEDRVKEFMQGGSYPIERFSFAAHQAMLARPLPVDFEFITEIHAYVHLGVSINRTLDTIDNPAASLEYQMIRAKLALNTLPDFRKLGSVIERKVAGWLDRLDGTTPLS